MTLLFYIEKNDKTKNKYIFFQDGDCDIPKVGERLQNGYVKYFGKFMLHNVGDYKTAYGQHCFEVTEECFMESIVDCESLYIVNLTERFRDFDPN